MNCILLICYKPKEDLIDFYAKFKHYNVFIIIDDETEDYLPLALKYKDTNLNFICMTHINCMIAGITNLSFTLNKMVAGWEKALLFISEHMRNYDKIWILEDDVFFYNEQTLIDIDLKYPNSDLLTSTYYENTPEDKWLWNVIPIYGIEPPYYHAMVCSSRLSNNLLSNIYFYAKIYKTLFFIEALLPTIAKKSGLIYDTPIEFSSVQYCATYDDYSIFNKNYLYHPLKNVKSHNEIRNYIDKTP